MMGSVQGKAWGTTQCLFFSNNVEVHRIVVNRGGYCSRHRHKKKHNFFYVESGILRVTIFRSEIASWANDDSYHCPRAGEDVTVLSAGMSTTIAPGECHQFVAEEDSVVFEIYHTELDRDDIERFSHGGCLVSIVGDVGDNQCR